MANFEKKMIFFKYLPPSSPLSNVHIAGLNQEKKDLFYFAF